jgi:hypothetical protein
LKKDKEKESERPKEALDEINETLDTKPRFFEGSEKRKEEEEDTENLFEDDEDIPLNETKKIR